VTIRVALGADAPHVEGAGELRHPLADRAEPDDPERLAAHQVDREDRPRVRRLLAHRARQAAAERQQHRHGVLGDRVAGDAGAVQDPHAAGAKGLRPESRGLEEVVGPGARELDPRELRHACKQLSRHASREQNSGLAKNIFGQGAI
jgi:hypothetical protein